MKAGAGWGPEDRRAPQPEAAITSAGYVRSLLLLLLLLRAVALAIFDTTALSMKRALVLGRSL